MKSTIKNAYERQIAADGSVTLSYRASRFGANHMGLGLIFLFLIFGAFVFFSLIGMILLIPFERYPSIHIPGAFIFGCVCTFWLTRRVLGGKTYTLVLTQQGMIFPRGSYGAMTYQLPYVEINGLGVTKMQASHNGVYSESCSVYAYTGGTEVKVTRDIPQSLAETFIQEINQHRAKVAA